MAGYNAEKDELINSVNCLQDRYRVSKYSYNGGEVCFGEKMIDLNLDNGKVKSIKTNLRGFGSFLIEAFNEKVTFSVHRSVDNQGWFSQP